MLRLSYFMSTNPHLQWDVVIYVNVTALILYGNIFCCLPWAVFVWLLSFSYLCLFLFFLYQILRLFLFGDQYAFTAALLMPDCAHVSAG